MEHNHGKIIVIVRGTWFSGGFTGGDSVTSQGETTRTIYWTQHFLKCGASQQKNKINRNLFKKKKTKEKNNVNIIII